MLMTGLEGMNGLSGPLGQLQPHEALAHMAGHLPHMVALSSQQQMQMPHMIQTYPAHEQLQMLQVNSCPTYEQLTSSCYFWSNP